MVLSISSPDNGTIPSASRRDDWTPERVETLTTMWLAGEPASAIAKALKGVSRSAVIGKVHRLCLVRSPDVSEANTLRARKGDGSPRAPRQRRAPHSVNYVRKAPRPKRPRLTADKQRRMAYADRVALESRKLTLLQVKLRGECKYATHEEGEHLFCGHPSDAGGSFCAAHSRLVYNTQPRPEHTPNIPDHLTGAARSDESGQANHIKVAA